MTSVKPTDVINVCNIVLVDRFDDHLVISCRNDNNRLESNGVVDVHWNIISCDSAGSTHAM